MGLRFVKIDPCGNTTIIVLDPIPREEYASVAAKLMNKNNVYAEQVGYLELPKDPHAAARLHMMGGEFCGNAARGFAAWIALGGLENEELVGFDEAETSVSIEVSGHNELLRATITNTGRTNACYAEIEMPMPLEQRHGQHASLGEYTIVVFEGILHLVLWGKPPEESCVSIARELILQEGLSVECFGIMFYDSYTGKVYPLVSIGPVGSLVWESSCGSGSVAVACAYAEREKKAVKEMEFRNPGGNLYVTIETDALGKQARAKIGGEITVTAIGVAYTV